MQALDYYGGGKNDAGPSESDTSKIPLERVVKPTPATRSIWTVLKAGECIRHSI